MDTRCKINTKKIMYIMFHTAFTRYKLLLLLLICTHLIGCQQENRSDAYGQFEATETTISAEISGKLLHFSADEGEMLDMHRQVGVVDTVITNLKRKELKEQIASTRARIKSIQAEVNVQQEDLELANITLNRTKRMYEDGAATDQQLDDINTKVDRITKRINALQTDKKQIFAEIRSMQARIQQLDQQIKDAIIINPIKGTVLTSFVEQYEMVITGQPLYRIANLDTLTLRVYVSGAQLPEVKIGQQLKVLIDKNKTENQSMQGKVTWIASEAEFTPQMIQTKEERVSQVYAVEVDVPNPEGVLKIGMPGEVQFSNLN